MYDNVLPFDKKYIKKEKKKSPICEGGTSQISPKRQI